MTEFADRIQLLDHLPRHGIVAEVGVQRGDFAAEILQRCCPRLLLLIDCWQHQPGPRYSRDKSNVSQTEHEKFYHAVCERFRDELAGGRVVVLRGFSCDVLQMLPDHWLDWIYLDADHSVEAVSQDLQFSARKVRDNGLICGHDYVESGDSQFGVVEAVSAFCSGSAWRLAMRTRNDRICDGFDSYVLKRGGFSH